jgi:two-component system sensor histidine kinase KdpD
MSDRGFLAQAASALAVSGAAAFAAHLLEVDAVTASMIFLVGVLCLSARMGFVAGALASVLATLGFDYLYLAPAGTLLVADAQGWISLGCFLLATTLASRLVGSARERSVEAAGRQREIAALYELCVDLFTASARPGGLDAATSQALRTIGVRSGGLVLPAEEQSEPSGWIGGAGDFELHKFLDRGLAADASTDSEPSSGLRNVRVPVVVDGRTAGVLVAYGTRARRETLESVAKLIALSFERERLLTEQARLEGLQASDSFKTSLLRAVSHDLSTPLTAMLLSLGTLGRELANDAERRTTIDLIVEEATRLHRRIKDLLAMARLESGGFALQREPSPPADLFRAARENLGGIAAKRRIESRVARECPDLDVDPSLALEILVNLIENAHRASPASEPIELVASRHPDDDARVRLEVLDRGTGLAGESMHLSGEEPSPAVSTGDGLRKGLGLEIARSFAAAHGGSLSLAPRRGGGVCVQIDLPAARLVGS